MVRAFVCPRPSAVRRSPSMSAAGGPFLLSLKTVRMSGSRLFAVIELRIAVVM
jgi:hypothetical protein